MKLVAFDIETLGLLDEEPLPEITCVCLHDGERDYAFRIWQLPDAERAAHVEAVQALLDAADRILGYNAVLFDLEFLRRAWGVPQARMLAWVLKCVDPFLHVRDVLACPCRFQCLLDLNGLSSKTGSGSSAIALARAGAWDALLAYCVQDARLTYALCVLPWTRLTPGLDCSLLACPPAYRLHKKTGGEATEATPKALPKAPWSEAWAPLPPTDAFATVVVEDDEK